MSFSSINLEMRRLNIRFRRHRRVLTQVTVDQILTLAELLRDLWEFDDPVYVCFVDSEKFHDHQVHVLQGIL